MTQSIEINNNTSDENTEKSKVKKEIVSLLYSTPLNRGYTLFAEVPLKSSIETAKHWRNWYYFPGAAIIAFLLSIILYILASLIIRLPYSRTKNALDKANNLIKEMRSAPQQLPQEEIQIPKQDDEIINDESAYIKEDEAINNEPAYIEEEEIINNEPDYIEEEKIINNEPAYIEEEEIINNEPDYMEIDPEIQPAEPINEIEEEKNNKYTELTNLFLKENEKKSKLISSLELTKQNLNELLKYCLYEYTSIKNTAVYIVLNSSNNIIFAADKTGTILKDKNVSELNIADAVLIPEIAAYANEAAETPNTNIEFATSMLNISFYCISVKGNIIGTIISNN
jgi:hypothetical protein